MGIAGALKDSVLDINGNFDELAMEVFRYQAAGNPVYREYISRLRVSVHDIKQPEQVPFLPISFFKSHDVICSGCQPVLTFTSSGTTGQQTSRHLVADPTYYIRVSRKCFDFFYGDVKNFCLLALLPSYLEREGSSLVYMANDLISESGHPDSGFYLSNFEALDQTIRKLEQAGQPVLLLGVTYALLDLAEKFPAQLHHTIVMETGGMKGRREELLKDEVHAVLKKSFGVNTIHSEYGMTELFSQAYSKGNGIFYCPPWMKVIVKDIHDPLGSPVVGKTGLIHVIDLANVDSCAFIATEDLGRVNADGSFEILGRLDNSDLRGCNLLMEGLE